MGGVIVHEQNLKLPQALDLLPPYHSDFNIGQQNMSKHVATLREGQPIPADLRAGITQAGVDLISHAKSSGVDLTKTREFSQAVDANGKINPVKVGALLFAASLETDASGKLRFDNDAHSSDLKIINGRFNDMMNIATNVELGRFSKDDSQDRLNSMMQTNKPRLGSQDIMQQCAQALQNSGIVCNPNEPPKPTAPQFGGIFSGDPLAKC